MATLSVISYSVGYIALLLAFISWIHSLPQKRIPMQQCPNRPFEDLYTCDASPYDYLPGKSPGIWGPWDWAPVCFIPEQATTSYCLVSSAKYNGNRGVSIIARQDFVPQFQQAMSDDNAALAASLHRDLDGNKAYNHRKIPGKGIGVIARRNITRGVSFMASFPGIIFDNEFRDLLNTDTSAQEVYRLAVEQLADQERVMGLARSAGGEPLEDVLRTNAHIARFAGRRLAMLYPEVARINHACNPNALVRFSPSTLMMEVIAVQDIAAGEEITIIYIEDGLEFSDRKSSLAAFKFECHCALCTAAPDAISTSDKKRRRIHDILKELHKSNSSLDVQKLVSELISLTREEKLGPSAMKRHYHELMRLFFEKGHIRSAVLYAQQALLLSEEFDGPEDADGLQRALRRNLDVLEGYLPSEAK